MKQYKIYILCLMALQTSQTQSWLGSNAIDDFKRSAQNGIDTVSHPIAAAKNYIESKIPNFLYYWPNLTMHNLLFGIKDMSFTCNDESFLIIDNGHMKQAQLFTRLAKIFGDHSSFNTFAAQKNAKEGLYLTFSFNPSSHRVSIITSESFVTFGKITDIGTAHFKLLSTATPTKITCTVNGKSKTFDINKRLHIAPWIKTL